MSDIRSGLAAVGGFALLLGLLVCPGSRISWAGEASKKASPVKIKPASSSKVPGRAPLTEPSRTSHKPAISSRSPRRKVPAYKDPPGGSHRPVFPDRARTPKKEDPVPDLPPSQEPSDCIGHGHTPVPIVHEVHPWVGTHVPGAMWAQKEAPPSIEDRPSTTSTTASPTGSRGLGYDPWEYEDLPCDYGLKFVEPADKRCRTNKDCGLLPVLWDCCGSVLLVGVSKREIDTYQKLSKECYPVLKWCACTSTTILAEDRLTTEDPSVVQVACVRGRCRSFVERD